MEQAIKAPDAEDKRYIEIDSAETVVTLVPIGDTHWENRGCDVQALRDCVQWIKKEPNCYAVMMGDALECTAQDHKFFHPRQLRKDFDADNVWEGASATLAHELRPIRDKILGVMTGNHEWRLESRYGYNTTQVLCNILNDDLVSTELRSDYRQIEKFKLSLARRGHPKAVKNYRYSSVVTLTFSLKTKGQTSRPPKRAIRLYFHHGAGGGATQGAAINKLVKMGEHFEGVDIFVMGHYHRDAATRTQCFTFSHTSNELIARDRLFVIVPAFLQSYYEGHSDYAERNMMPPAVIGWTPIRIKPFHGKDRKNPKFWVEV